MTSRLSINQLLRLLFIISFTTPGYSQQNCGDECKDSSNGNVSCAEFRERGLCKISAIASTTCPCTCDLCESTGQDKTNPLQLPIQQQQIKTPIPNQVQKPTTSFHQNSTTELDLQSSLQGVFQSSSDKNATIKLSSDKEETKEILEVKIPSSNFSTQGQDSLNSSDTRPSQANNDVIKEVTIKQESAIVQKSLFGGNLTRLDSKQSQDNYSGDVKIPTPELKQPNQNQTVSQEQSQKQPEKQTSVSQDVDEAAVIKNDNKLSEENENVKTFDESKNQNPIKNSNQTNVINVQNEQTQDVKKSPIPAKIPIAQNVSSWDAKKSPIPSKIPIAQNVSSQETQKVPASAQVDIKKQQQQNQNVIKNDGNNDSQQNGDSEQAQKADNKKQSKQNEQSAPSPELKQNQNQNNTVSQSAVEAIASSRSQSAQNSDDLKQENSNKNTSSTKSQNKTGSIQESIPTDNQKQDQNSQNVAKNDGNQNQKQNQNSQNVAKNDGNQNNNQTENAGGTISTKNDTVVANKNVNSEEIQNNNNIKVEDVFEELAQVPESFDESHETILTAPEQEKVASEKPPKNILSAPEQEEVTAKKPQEQTKKAQDQQKSEQSQKMFAPKQEKELKQSQNQNQTKSEQFASPKQEQKQPEKVDGKNNETKVEFPKVEEFKKRSATKKSSKPVEVGCGKSRPNFLVIMTDDQGHDDIGFYNWNHVLKTPNMDKLAQNSVQFENFYTDPLCAPTRASLLTGRHHLKTGVWGVHGGMDYINLDETLIAEALQYHGYKTAHFGKWHSGTTPGYNPWDRGFELSYTTKLYTFYNTVVRKNGWEMNTNGWVEDWLADRIVEYLDERRNDGQPFFILWTPMSIHKGRKHDSEWYEDFVAPEWYYDHYWGKVSTDLVHVFAMLEYFDSVLGRVMWKLEEFGLTDDTVVMFFGDNGPHIYQTDHEWGDQRYLRVPSQMAEQKGFIDENGIRNFLFVQGGGMFPAGRQVYENVGVFDIYPTILNLAGVSPPEWNKPLDGVSFAPLLCQDGWWTHTDRYLFFHEILKNSLGTNEIFNLDETRETDRYQEMLKYWNGGTQGQGFQYSTGVRHKQWKYVKTELFDIPAANYQEYDWTKFSGKDWSKSENLKEFYKGKIDEWWWSVLADPGAFKKPTYLIGKEEYNPVKAIGLIERTPWHIFVGDQSVSGFKHDGDYLICRVRVLKEGNYNVRLNFGWSGYKGAYIQIAVGQHWQLWNGEAPSVERKIDNNGPLGFGNIYLKATSGQDDEMMIRLNGRDWNDGSQIFSWIDSVEFITQS